MADKAVIDPQSTNIDSILHEQRKFECPPEFAERAHIKSLADYERLYNESVDDPDKFWSRVANELHWFKKWDKVLEWNCPWAKWFVGGEINLSYNCLDRHVTTHRKNKAAIIWESEPGEIRVLTYQQLHREVQKFANVLKGLGVKKGDRVAIYMGMTPELAIAMLACARIGAPHTVVFGGFSSNALIDRIHDSQASTVITQDGSYRRGGEVKLFPAVEDALKSCPSVKHVVIYKRTGTPINMQAGRDHWWHELMAKASDVCPAEPLDSEHPLYILYTSGTTGKPKGVVHTTGGYSVGTYLTTKWVFDLKDEDTYWCTADIGWVTGHSYIVYGPLQNGATSLLFAIDARTLDYLRATGRSGAHIDRVQRYAKAQGLWGPVAASDATAVFDRVVDFDLGSAEPAMAGPHRPEQRVSLAAVPSSFRRSYPTRPPPAGDGRVG